MVTKSDYDILIGKFNDTAAVLADAFVELSTEFTSLKEQIDAGGLPVDVEQDVKNRLDAASAKLADVASQLKSFADANAPAATTAPAAGATAPPADATPSTEPAPAEPAPVS